MALLTVEWRKWNDYHDEWQRSATHLTLDGKITLCSNPIPSWLPRGEGNIGTLCRKCARVYGGKRWHDKLAELKATPEKE